MSELTSAQRSEIMAALERGKKIEAIKLYRQATGSGLVDAKRFIETLQHALAPGTESAHPSARLAKEDSDAIVQLLQAGKKIQAIKVYREATGVGLKAARESVEAIASERGIPTGSGCGGPAVLLLALVIAGGICWR